MEELLRSADRLEAAVVRIKHAPYQAVLHALSEEADIIGNAWSGSNIGYHACVYYNNLQPPPPGIHFSAEWGLDQAIGMGTTGDWKEFSFDGVKSLIFERAGDPDLTAAYEESREIDELVAMEKSNLLSTFSIEAITFSDLFMESLREKTDRISVLSASQLAQSLLPAQAQSRDARAMYQGLRLAPHQEVMCQLAAIKSPTLAAEELGRLARQVGSHLARRAKTSAQNSLIGTNVFIGHGRSSLWRELKDFVSVRLRLPYDEFNRVPVAGITNIARLAQMLDSAAVAFVVLTAEDEQSDGSMRARMNVVHEAGLFQGRLGFTKAIVLLEEHCEEFSNIQGLGQIRFPKGKISAVFEEVRQLLEREKMLD